MIVIFSEEYFDGLSVQKVWVLTYNLRERGITEHLGLSEKSPKRGAERGKAPLVSPKI